jgi:hypothetical protein
MRRAPVAHFSVPALADGGDIASLAHGKVLFESQRACASEHRYYPCSRFVASTPHIQGL